MSTLRPCAEYLHLATSRNPPVHRVGKMLYVLTQDLWSIADFPARAPRQFRKPLKS
jgi:hypothetical protein